ncbi:hypothetical protein IQ254_07980 [Nodosilinea sp. LEGE 07088]|uniref:hypothetical protein n=1 Tax=Nodosilinea sp. LEGE 07088 TaxID=2777968 RepID=UPI00187FDC2A|nr:hypothetical protein [Nodosilinea sp. LEGE 07088]MBE9137142.1 hypothetical protein [Nodosilinea sp. LEGE 07088]
MKNLSLNLILLIGAGLAALTVVGISREPALSEPFCYMITESGETVDLTSNLCQNTEEEMPVIESNEPNEIVDIEGARSGPYTVGDTMDDGVRILSNSGDIVEFLYPTGAKVVRDLRNETISYISPSGEEVAPGSSIELFEGERVEVQDMSDPEFLVDDSALSEIGEIDDEGFLRPY